MLNITDESIILDGDEYYKPNGYLELLEKNGIQFDDNYANYLKENIWIYNLYYIFKMDYYDKLYFGNDGILGKICRLDEYGQIDNKYDNFADVVFSEYDNPKASYCFEKLLKKSSYDIEFFGEKIKINDEPFELHILNSEIKKKINCFKKKKPLDMLHYEKEYKGKVSLFDYITKEIISFSMTFAYNLFSRNKGFDASKNGKSDLVKSEIDKILAKYSIDGQCLFDEIKELATIKSKPGIFLLVYTGEIYLGYSNDNIYLEILNQVKLKKNLAARYKPYEVKKIYALNILDNELLDILVMDCFARLEYAVILNKELNGLSKFSDTKEISKYLLSDGELITILNNITK